MRQSTLFLGTIVWLVGWHFVKNQASQRTTWLLLGVVSLLYFLLSTYVAAMERRLRNDYLAMTPEEREGFRQALVSDGPKDGEESYRQIAEDRRTDWWWVASDGASGFSLTFGLPVVAQLVREHKLSLNTNIGFSEMIWMLIGGGIYWWMHVTTLKRYRCRVCKTALTRDRSRPGVIFPCERCQCVWHLGDM